MVVPKVVPVSAHVDQDIPFYTVQGAHKLP
jgi:hypothetical protein